MLIALLRANSGKPFFQYKFNLWQKITLSKNSAIIRCYSEVMTSPFYIVKLESFTIEGMLTRAKKGLPTEVTFWTFQSDFKHCVTQRLACIDFSIVKSLFIQPFWCAIGGAIVQKGIYEFCKVMSFRIEIRYH